MSTTTTMSATKARIERVKRLATDVQYLRMFGGLPTIHYAKKDSRWQARIDGNIFIRALSRADLDAKIMQRGLHPDLFVKMSPA
jgi:hypothetical protein